MSVKVTCGANTFDANVNGQTVAQVREAMLTLMTIPANAEAVIDGAPANNNTRVYDGQTLQFRKDTGAKG